MGRTLLASMLASVSLLAQPLTQRERDFAMSHLHATRKMFLGSVAGLSPAQWNFKPAPGVWSVAECAEHLALSEDGLYSLVTEKIMKSPPAPEKRSPSEAKDNQVLKLIAGRETKAQAPQFLQPAKRWATPAAAVEHFKESRDRTIAYVEKSQEDLRAHFAPNPAFDELDAYQWILMIAAHTERHVKQVQEVKAHPDFPRK